MRALILSDIHGNLAALESVLTAAQGHYDTVWCLGDVVGYGPRPNECVELIRDLASVCVMGNHDWAVLDRPGLSVDDFNPHARQAVLWTREVLTPENLAYLEDLAYKPVHPTDDTNLLLTHASPREPVSEYVLTPGIAMDNFSFFKEAICLVGHTHKPVIYRWRLQDRLYTEPAESAANPEVVAISGPASAAPATTSTSAQDDEPTSKLQPVATVDGLRPPPGKDVQLEVSVRQRLILNPGSVGQPRDNDVRAAFAILDLEQLIWRYERVAYPIDLTQNQMRAVKLPKRLIDRLSFGL
ncbi:MAG: metallophosphoesterase family protein [Caldilineaceae bacterium]